MPKKSDRARMFLRLEGIPGGSKAKGHGGWIRVTSVDWGVEQTIHIGGGGSGAAAVGAKQRGVRFSAATGIASPLLLEACLSGKRLREGVFEVQQATSVVAHWAFEDVLITAFGSGAADGAAGLVDSFTLSAQRIRYTTKSACSWDFAINKPW